MVVYTASAPAGRTAKKDVPARRAPLSKTAQVAKKTPPVPQAVNGVSPFEIMAGRIANRVAEMAENVTFVERQPKATQSEAPQANARKPPRKLEIRLPNAGADGVKFSAPFLDNTLAKMLALQNRMLKTGSEIAASDASEKVKREQFEQSAELSRIIALICAEKARQGA
ncbi:uncharacterized protein PV09_09163 [Verruconis gallopava]|uniref:Uncharacterized protein n=1 Tax=Verruconis gallopava TaxID=253628 RepID=A0A0D1YEI3_9PEZI|nr:uncharacterized protein PV09_09163 [Verruconis gallopava]KIV99131.1 hypothetical protein PV09_09163 [Verruconis gallopava]